MKMSEFPKKAVKSIDADQFVIDALKMLDESALSSLAVVSKDGQLLSAFSASHIKVRG
jgi:CBS domain-containing protein